MNYSTKMKTKPLFILNLNYKKELKAIAPKLYFGAIAKVMD